MSRSIRFDGACPFILCLELDRHEHPVCEVCETVNYGNMQCDDCRALRPDYDAKVIARWNEHKAVVDRFAVQGGAP